MGNQKGEFPCPATTAGPSKPQEERLLFWQGLSQWKTMDSLFSTHLPNAFPLNKRFLFPLPCGSPWLQNCNSLLMPLEGLILKLKLQYFGHLMLRANSLEKTLILGKIEGMRMEQQRMWWLDGVIDSMDMRLSKLQEMKDREAWHATVHVVAKSQTRFCNWTKEKKQAMDDSEIAYSIMGAKCHVNFCWLSFTTYLRSGCIIVSYTLSVVLFYQVCRDW